MGKGKRAIYQEKTPPLCLFFKTIEILHIMVVGWKILHIGQLLLGNCNKDFFPLLHTFLFSPHSYNGGGAI